MSAHSYEGKTVPLIEFIRARNHLSNLISVIWSWRDAELHGYEVKQLQQEIAWMDTIIAEAEAEASI